MPNSSNVPNERSVEARECLRLSIREFVEREMPREAAARWDRENEFPRDVFARLARMGVMGLAIPRALGGTGRDIVSTMVVIEELSRRSLAVSVPYIMASCYAGMNLVEFGSPGQQRDLLPRVTSGDLIFAYGWTEPDVGADLASVKTRAVRDGHEVVIDGAKRFCSGAALCDYIYTLVRTGDVGDRHGGLSLVLVPPSTPGVQISKIDAMGMKGAATTDVVFDGVRVPVANVMGGEAGWGRGWAMLIGAGLDVEKLEVAAIGIGIATAALDDAWRAVCAPRSGERPDQSATHQLADMKAQVHAARLVLYHAAELADRHEKCSVETSMAKLLAGEAARDVALRSQVILGIEGYVQGRDAERHVRDALLVPIMGGSSAIQRNNIFKWSAAAT